MPGAGATPGPGAADPPVAEATAARRSGLDIAREALAAAKAEAKRRGSGRGRARKQSRSQGAGQPFSRRVTPEQRSGAHPDERDPQVLASSVERLLAERGWHTDIAVGSVMARWALIVGSELAEHCEPVTFEDGRLVVQADSTAWATQLRLLASSLLRRLNDELGPGTVTTVKVLGPQAPSWKRGRLSVRGRGARDTYG